MITKFYASKMEHLDVVVNLFDQTVVDLLSVNANFSLFSDEGYLFIYDKESLEGLTSDLQDTGEEKYDYLIRMFERDLETPFKYYIYFI